MECWSDSSTSDTWMISVFTFSKFNQSPTFNLHPWPLSPSQIHAHYELKKTSRHRRNLAITGGVALSIITAPVIAAVSVGEKLDNTRHLFYTVNLWGWRPKQAEHSLFISVQIHKGAASLQNEIKYTQNMMHFRDVDLNILSSNK